MIAFRAAVAAVGLCCAITGCSYGYDIYATFDGKNLLFNTHAKESRRAPGLCLRYLEVRSGTSLLWKIVREGPLGECRSDFPIKYGIPPPRFKTSTPPSALRPGVVYRLTGGGDASFEGSFRYSVHKVVTVQNLEVTAEQ
jgi:hypothetical protein